MTKQDVDILIKSREGFHLDLKRSMNANHANTMVSFANADGGKILLRTNEKDIYQTCLSKAEYSNNGFFKIKVSRVKASVNAPINESENPDNQLLSILLGQDAPINAPIKRRVEIIKSVMEEKLNRKQLASKLNATENQIRRDIEELKPYLKFEGANKTGGYVITNELEKLLK